MTFTIPCAVKAKALLRNMFSNQVVLVVRRLVGQLLPVHCKKTMTHLQEIYSFAVVLLVTYPHLPVHTGKCLI
jgi:hypothetical protein